MSEETDLDTLRAQLDLVLQLLREKDDLRLLLDQFARGKVDRDRVINELATRYQLGIGSALRALSEHDVDAAKRAGERLRLRIDNFLGEITGQPAQQHSAQSVRASFKDRDDTVLLREYVMVRELNRSDTWVKLVDLIGSVRAGTPDATDEVVTAHLGRLLKANLIGRERKGKYHGTTATREHMSALADEIEARRLHLPQA